MEIKITYTGGLDTELDKKKTKFFKSLDYDFTGSGMEIETQIRDIGFEKAKGYKTAVDPHDSSKGNKFVRTNN